jgi:sigma-B regulation protein RsbU (phosphoserine phosphatase)
LAPARETSGDFFDAFPLPGGRIGFLVADVVDKGVGAALFMALCATLLRTYAAEYPGDPARAFAEVNRRILADTDANQFVTVFYGVLHPVTGEVAYCNAGQCPALHVSPDGNAIELIRTGPPLGAFEEGTWEAGRVALAGGDTLVLYTDGVIEAEHAEGEFYGAERLLACVRVNLGQPPARLCDAILADVVAFAGVPHPADDIALVVLKRDP